ncbi:ankyrin repeat domain-containing protein [Erythrobacter sp. QSSC1-22B]|uniref:ankyrin repeat domain-containing protein n=1 Tax=Erythrobacter sp. QSSC1-22B TaxID=1860125 RepID=UPI001F26A001|nr:ankyrin repeat domain-containing protein [Erythrobacter sp. QSSC1-22B]
MKLRFGTRYGLAGALAGALLAGPLAAQNFSEGYEFLKAVQDREGATVTEMLNQPGTVIANSRDITSGRTAMHIVVERRDLTWIRFLHSKGTNPDIADKKGITPLLIASNLGFLEGVEALLEAGARVDQSNAAGETPLISSIHRRDVGMVRLLLDKGANPDRNDNSGRSARDYAALIVGGTQIMDAIAQADAERSDDAQASYGPSF